MVGPDVAVGHVRFPVESLGAAARYAASFAAGPA
ncbi:hypothetical protein EV383_2834 [Pseudonocardia sediminis]|uniref:Uncharacterized protein n=1 Tax=Pseudonocardia sediminis TaxID=1397368 RepID=A0A4Q7UVV5_PSEST|nr:hypothetical protein EV383_2834 [Pseudonocardia sediminis]